MTWLRLVVLTGAVLMLGVGCDGDACDTDEQCFSNDCSYGTCGSTVGNIAVRAIEHALDDEDDDYDEYEPSSSYESYEVPDEQQAWSWGECNAGYCYPLTEEQCRDAEGCEYSFGSCTGTPRMCEELDYDACLHEPACIARPYSQQQY